LRVFRAHLEWGLDPGLESLTPSLKR
jgi:hypothetical protein